MIVKQNMVVFISLELHKPNAKQVNEKDTAVSLQPASGEKIVDDEDMLF